MKISQKNLTAKDRSYIADYSQKLIRDLLTERDAVNINISRFTEVFHHIINHIEKITDDKDSVLLQTEVLEITDTYIESFMMYQNAGKYTTILRKSWMAPAMIQKMIENVDDEQCFYRLAMEHIRAQGAKSAFIYLLETPQRYKRGEEFICPDVMYLASEFVNDKIISYKEDERPVITQTDGINSRYPSSPGHRYVAYILFAEEYQYGLMLCETNPAEFGILYGIGLQISTAQAYLQMSKKEAQAKQQLYDTLKELEEKNQILNFTSSYDPLTNLYNRRGFMENAIELVKQNTGKKAALFFSDLDHLKQINDIYGHIDGDFAINSSAQIIKSIFEQPAFSGRIGGDEFVSITLIDEKSAESISADIKENIKKLNEDSTKPYYIEFSSGYVEFVCSDDIVIKDIVDQADKVLYEVKKKRRESVVRN